MPHSLGVPHSLGWPLTRDAPFTRDAPLTLGGPLTRGGPLNLGWPTPSRPVRNPCPQLHQFVFLDLSVMTKPSSHFRHDDVFRVKHFPRPSTWAGSGAPPKPSFGLSGEVLASKPNESSAKQTTAPPGHPAPLCGLRHTLASFAVKSFSPRRPLDSCATDGRVAHPSRLFGLRFFFAAFATP